MRFQQLKRDPNSVMRKKLVKSKKAWVVVSSLSIAGGLLMMTAPSYVAKAEVTTAASTTQTETKPSSTGTTSQDSSKVAVPATSAPAPTTTADGGGSKTVEVPTTKSAVESGTEVKSTEDASDLTKESTPETTTKETSEPAPTVEKPTVKDTTAETSGTETETAAPDTKVTALSVVAPTTGVGQETTVPDGSTDEKTGLTPTDPETTVTGDSITDVKTPLDATLTADSLTTGAVTPVVPVVPALEDVTTPAENGNGWKVTDSGTNLHITGPLDEGTKVVHERWGGNTSTISQINIEPSEGTTTIAAPIDSSYLFANMTNLKTISGLDKLVFSSNDSKPVNAEGMFKNDVNLAKVDFSKNDVSKFQNISHMFENDHKLETVSFSTNSFKQIVDGSYAFANCESLTDFIGPEVTPGQGPSHSMNQWIASHATDLRGFFKNDISFKTINVYTWAWNDNTETGDSSIGEGMFDGTSLDSIVLNAFLHFNPKTALTSGNGTVWKSTNTSGLVQTFTAMPTFDATNNITSGLGYLYDDVQDHFNGGYDKTNVYSNPYKRLEFTIDKTTKSSIGDAVDNIVNVQTDQGPITFTAHGKFGETSTVPVPTTYTFNGTNYNSTSLVQVTFGQMTPTAAVIAVDANNAVDPKGVTYSLPLAKSGDVTVKATTNGVASEPIKITVPAGDYHVGDTTSVKVPLPAGYHTSDGSTTISVTFDKTTGEPVIADTTIAIIGDNVTGKLATLDAVTGQKRTPITVTIPDGALGTTKEIKPNQDINGYETPKLTVTYTAVGPVLSQNGADISTDNPITYTGNANTLTSVSFTKPDGSTTTWDIPDGNYGNKDGSVTNDKDAVEGYVTPVLKVVYGPEGIPTITDQFDNTVDSTHPVKYTGVANTLPSVSFTKPDGTKATWDIPNGKYKDSDASVTDNKDAVDGYVTPVLKVVYGTEGIPTITDQFGNVVNDDNPVKYTGVANTLPSVSFTKPNGTKATWTIPDGKYKDSDASVTDNRDAVDGYVTPVLKVVYGTEGIPTITDQFGNVVNDDNPVKYTGVANKLPSVSFTKPDGTKATWDIPDGKYKDSDTSVTDDKDAVKGYVTPVLKVVYGTEGTPSITDQFGNTVDSTHPVKYTGVANTLHSVSVTKPDGSTATWDIPNGNYKDSDASVTNDTDAVDGYVTPVLKVVYGTEGTPTITDQFGNTVDSTHPVKYTGVANTLHSVSFTKPDGSTTTWAIPNGNYKGSDASVTEDKDAVKGYITPVLKVVYGSDGTPSITDQFDNTVDSTHPVKYTGVANTLHSVSFTKPDGTTTTWAIPNGNYKDGDASVTEDKDAVKGYVTPVLKVVYGADGIPSITDQFGNVVNDDNPVKYTGVANKLPSVSFTKPDGTTATWTIPNGNYKDSDASVTDDKDAVDGYVTPVLKVVYGTNGIPTITDQFDNTVDSTHPVKYTGVANKLPSVSFTKPDGTTTTWAIPSGKYRDSDASVTDDKDAIKGYVTPVLKVVYGTDGIPSITDQFGNVVNDDNPVKYTGVANKLPSVSFTKPDGTTATWAIPNGNYKDGDASVTEDKDAVKGYVTPVLKVVYGADGIPSITDQFGNVVNDDNPVKYTGVANKLPSVSFTKPDGTTATWAIPNGNYGNKDASVTDDKDAVDGYVTPILKVVYGTEGTPTITDQFGNTVDSNHPLTYTGKPNAKQTLTVKNPNGSTSDLVIPAGNYGDGPVTVTAPTIAGYKAPSVTVTYNANGIPTITDTTGKSISTTDDLTYTKNPSRSSSHPAPVVPVTVAPVSPNEGVIEHKVQTISTYGDQPNVDVYQLDANNNMVPITNYVLDSDSNWYSDAVTRRNGVNYYRIATNEWAKISQVYPYQELNNLHVRTYDDSEKDLYRSENELIKNETLAPDSSWLSDRETYAINDSKYYRVATDKFVDSADVYVYEPVQMVVTTHATTRYTKLYTAKGVLITNRSLSENTSWSVDSITYINGEKYYRVATNEFVKASDVDGTY